MSCVYRDPQLQLLIPFQFETKHLQILMFNRCLFLKGHAQVQNHKKIGDFILA